MSPQLEQALASIRKITEATADIAIILGSGLGDYAEQIDGVSIPWLCENGVLWYSFDD